MGLSNEPNKTVDRFVRLLGGAQEAWFKAGTDEMRLGKGEDGGFIVSLCRDLPTNDGGIATHFRFDARGQCVKIEAVLAPDNPTAANPTRNVECEFPDPSYVLGILSEENRDRSHQAITKLNGILAGNDPQTEAIMCDVLGGADFNRAKLFENAHKRRN